jgi:two-component system NtrC family sensor kinase
MTREQILVIDDSREILDFLATLLVKAGYRVSGAVTGKEGVARALRERPDLLLLDLSLPIMSGLQVMQALNRARFESPVILMTSFGSENVVVQALRLGARDYLNKPFDIDQLLAAVERCLETGRLRREREQLVSQLADANLTLTRRMQELSTLQAVGRSVASLMPEEELWRRILDSAVMLTAADAAALFLLEEAGQPPYLRAARHGARYLFGLRVPVPDGLVAEVMRSGRPLSASDPTERTGITDYLGARAQSLLYAPIRLGQATNGVLAVACLHTAQVSEETQERLLALADYVAIAVENARLHEAMRHSIAAQTVRETVTALAHHVNNPLQTLLSSAELLRSQLPAEGGHSDIIAAMERDVQSIAAVISVLSDLASPESTVYIGSARMLDIAGELQARAAQSVRAPAGRPH